MKKRTILRVVPFIDGWAVKKINPKRNQILGAWFPKWGESKADAIRAAVGYAKEHQPSQVLIHGRDGRFQREMSYGCDSPGRKG